MPQYIEVPGHGTVEFPDGMSEADIGEAIRTNIFKQDVNVAAASPRKKYSPEETNPAKGRSALDLAAAGAGKFAVDTARGVRQLGVDALAKTPYDPFKLGPYSNQLRQQESMRQTQDAPLMDTPAGMAGYVGGGAATLAAGGMAAPGGVARAILAPSTAPRALLSGGVLGAAAPVGEDGSRMNNAAMGALSGGAAGLLSKVPARVARPMGNVSDDAALLIKEGVVPTPGQAAARGTIPGKIIAGIEEKAQSIPVVGDIITHARNRAVTDLNKAAVKRAGGKGAGYEAIDKAHTGLNQQFESLTQGVKVKLDNTFNVSLSDLTLTDDAQKIVQKKLGNIFNAAQGGEISGQAYSKFRGELAAAGKKYMRSPSPADHDLGMAFSRIADGLDSAFESQAPEATRNAWATARSQWANLMRVEDAASKAIGSEGVFTPSQLRQAVKTGGGKSQTARGNALMQDLAEAGMSLQSKTPNSGSIDRLLAAGLMGGGAMAVPGGIPALAGATGAAAAAYGARPITKYMVGGFPGQSPIAQALERLTPGAAHAGRLYMQER